MTGTVQRLQERVAELERELDEALKCHQIVCDANREALDALESSREMHRIAEEWRRKFKDKLSAIRNEAAGLWGERDRWDADPVGFLQWLHGELISEAARAMKAEAQLAAAKRKYTDAYEWMILSHCDSFQEMHDKLAEAERTIGIVTDRLAEECDKLAAAQAENAELLQKGMGCIELLKQTAEERDAAQADSERWRNAAIAIANLDRAIDAARKAEESDSDG